VSDNFLIIMHQLQRSRNLFQKLAGLLDQHYVSTSTTSGEASVPATAQDDSQQGSASAILSLLLKEHVDVDATLHLGADGRKDKEEDTKDANAGLGIMASP
jgi:hypothetical protein